MKNKKEKKGGNEITIANLDAVLIPEIDWLPMLFLYFSLVLGVEKSNLYLEIGVNGEPHLGSPLRPQPHEGGF